MPHVGQNMQIQMSILAQGYTYFAPRVKIASRKTSVFI